MITSMHIENFKCFKDFDIDLGPFNVLIGPNGSGKSSLLEAIRIAGSAPPGSNMPVSLYPRKSWSALGTQIAEQLVRPDRLWTWMKREGLTVAMRFYGRGGRQPDAPYEHIVSGDGWCFRSFLDVDSPPVPDGDKRGWLERDHAGWYEKTMGRVAYHSFEPAALKCPSLLTDVLTYDGHGFPGYLSHVLSIDRAVFDAIEQEFRRRFPEYEAVMMPSVNVAPHPQRDEPATPVREARDDFRVFLMFRRQGGVVLDATDVSDGHVVSLAFIALSCLPAPPNIVLIEEPENWIHHSSLKEIVTTLKQLSDRKDVQVVLTTHSPYLLDHVEPQEVRVFHKDEEGAVHAARMSDHPDVEGLKKHFSTGEIWTGFEGEKDIVAKTGEFK